MIYYMFLLEIIRYDIFNVVYYAISMTTILRKKAVIVKSSDRFPRIREMNISATSYVDCWINPIQTQVLKQSAFRREIESFDIYFF